jgi:cobalt/nickel transport system permease protein
MMGVLGAFIFTAQMINFAIPGTGSSGHLCGGLLLTILLDPYPAFLVIASVLTVQSLFFADGGLLAWGCNLFNMGFIPAFIAFPLVYRPLERKGRWPATIAAAITGSLLGALGVALETTASGISALPFGSFAAVMLSIHLAIGIVEALATGALVGFVSRARPEVLLERPCSRGLRPVLAGFLLAALVTGAALSCFASKRPDGLEWAVAKIIGSQAELKSDEVAHQQIAKLQKQTAILPNYTFRASILPTPTATQVNAGTSLSGVVGGLLTLGICGLIGLALKNRRARE